MLEGITAPTVDTYPLGLLGNHESEFQVIESKCVEVQLIGIGKENHVLDSILCLFIALPYYLLAKSSYFNELTRPYLSGEQQAEGQPPDPVAIYTRVQ